jgi:hypothetical protein
MVQIGICEPDIRCNYQDVVHNYMNRYIQNNCERSRVRSDNLHTPVTQQSRTIYTQNHLCSGGESIEDVDSFVYLGSKVTKAGGVAQDMAQQIQKANGAFVQIYPVWRNNKISTRTKLRIFHSKVKSMLLYRSETWKVAQTTTSKLQTFVNR